MQFKCLYKQKVLIDQLQPEIGEKELYQKIIQMGKELPPLHEGERIAANLLKGCQSQTYLVSELVILEGEAKVLIFRAESDALISAGLAALLIQVYAGESPETVLTCPPTFLQRLRLDKLLTPNRANGLYSMHLKMKQQALASLTG